MTPVLNYIGYNVGMMRYLITASLILVSTQTINGAAPQSYSKACLEAAWNLDWDWLNLKTDNGLSVSLSDNSISVHFSPGQKVPIPLDAVANYLQNGDRLDKNPGLDELIDHKGTAEPAKASYRQCAADLGRGGFFDFVNRSLASPNWDGVGGIVEIVDWLYKNNQGSLTGSLAHWHKGERVIAMFELLSGEAHDPPSINTLRAGYNAEAGKLFATIDNRLHPPPDWSAARKNIEWQKRANLGSLTGALRSWHQGNRSGALNVLLGGQVHDPNAQDVYRVCFNADAGKLFAIVDETLQNGNIR